jgi:plastocyanin domain-containing protein
MIRKHWMIGSLAGFGLMLGVSSASMAQTPHDEMQPSETTTSFRRIDQPTWLKGAVTAGGIGLIGVELWWFLFSKSKSSKADSNQGLQEATITSSPQLNPENMSSPVE